MTLTLIPGGAQQSTQWADPDAAAAAAWRLVATALATALVTPGLTPADREDLALAHNAARRAGGLA